MAYTDRQMRSTNLIGDKIEISLMKDRKGEDAKMINAVKQINTMRQKEKEMIEAEEYNVCIEYQKKAEVDERCDQAIEDIKK
jgi:sRNA-binding carbon storage regulator CsrA